MILFEGGTDPRYAIYRIPGIVATADGALLAYCEARRSPRGDWGATDILLRRSDDGGETWSAPAQMNIQREAVAKNPSALAQGLAGADEIVCGSPVAVADARPGVAHFLYCVENYRCFYRRSEDDGRNWTQPVEITAAFDGLQARYPWRVFALGPGHGIQLGGGRLLVPAWLSPGTGGHAHRPSAVTTLYSDDGGASWRAGEIVVEHGPEVINPSETALVELADGRVMANMRSESPHHRRLVSTSPGGIGGWSAPRVDEALFEPVCFGSLARAARPFPFLDQTAEAQRSQRGILLNSPLHATDADAGAAEPSMREAHYELVFVNPDSRSSFSPGQTWGRRENLVVRLSRDGGETWPLARVIDPGPAGYADLAAGVGGRMYCFYERGPGSQQLCLARFDREWLAGG